MATDAVGEMEIEAYIDGELDLSRRMAVEDHLSRNPVLAARMMADLRNRSALQLLANRDFALSRSLADTVEKARKDNRAFFWRRPAIGFAGMSAAAVLALAMMTWDAPPSPPSYVDLAVASHLSMKERVDPTVERPFSDDARTLLRASRIIVPRLPGDWRVIDVNLLEGAKQPAMLIAIETKDGKTLSILAIRERSSAPREPDTIREGGQSVAYWRKGDFSYALTGEGDPQQIDAKADALADSWST